MGTGINLRTGVKEANGSVPCRELHDLSLVWYLSRAGRRDRERLLPRITTFRATISGKETWRWRHHHFSMHILTALEVIPKNKAGYSPIWFHPDIRDYLLFPNYSTFLCCIFPLLGWFSSSLWFKELPWSQVLLFRDTAGYKVIPYIDNPLGDPSPIHAPLSRPKDFEFKHFKKPGQLPTRALEVS